MDPRAQAHIQEARAQTEVQARVEAKVEAEVEAKVATKAPPQVGSRWPRQCKNFIKLDMTYRHLCLLQCITKFEGFSGGAKKL